MYSFLFACLIIYLVVKCSSTKKRGYDKHWTMDDKEAKLPDFQWLMEAEFSDWFKDQKTINRKYARGEYRKAEFEAAREKLKNRMPRYHWQFKHQSGKVVVNPPWLKDCLWNEFIKENKAWAYYYYIVPELLRRLNRECSQRRLTLYKQATEKDELDQNLRELNKNEAKILREIEELQNLQ